VEFQRSDAADAAYRALDGAPVEKLGRILVSFVCPMKADKVGRGARGPPAPAPPGRRGGGARQEAMM